MTRISKQCYPFLEYIGNGKILERILDLIKLYYLDREIL